MEIGTDVALGTAALGGVGLAMVRDGRHRIVGATLAALGIPISWCLVKRTQTMAREVEFEAVQLAAIRQELGVQQVISLDLE